MKKYVTPQSISRSSVPHLTAILAVLCAFASGCTFTDATVNLPASFAVGIQAGGGGRELAVPELLDERAVRDRIGMKKNGYGMDTASILANEAVEKSLSERLRKELEAAGFKVKTDGDGPGVTKVQGSVPELFAEPVIKPNSLHL